MMKKILAYLFVSVAFALQAIGQINWTKNPVNPVLTRGANGDWDDVQVGSPTLIYDGTMYQMWYNGNDGNNTNIGYATSTDKISWYKHPTPVLEHGSAGTWDDLFILHPSVYFDGVTYHMWYTGTNGSIAQIGYATSQDSIHWNKYSNHPVLTPGDPGSWDGAGVNSPEVLFIDGVFHMWYGGSNGTYEQIGHAISLNGIDWEKDTLNPVLRVGGSGSWDNNYSSQSSVLFDGTYFHMWYGGGPNFGWKIGYAYSEDGRVWYKYDLNNPVLKPGSAGDWDNKYLGYQDVCFNSDSTGFDMWYTGSEVNGYVGDIGYATAPKELPFDFKNSPLIKYSGNPVLPRGANGDWDDVQVGSPTIIYNGTMYQMWYNGNNGSNTNIGYATSKDKINWDKHSTPVLNHGGAGSWDALFILHPSVYFDGTTYHMWYTGTNGSVAQIGYATSPDSIHWTKYSGNPVLTPGNFGSWDNNGVNSPEVLFIDGVFHMWYGGGDGTYEQIGHATSLNGIDWEKDTLNPILRVGNTGSWDKPYSSQPSVLFDGKIFHMWYGGGPNFGWNIGYAYSIDGRNWNKDVKNNPVLKPGSTGDWDSKHVGYQDVCFNSDSTGFDMWYTAGQSAGYIGDIGFAASDSTKGENPVADFTADSTSGEKPLTVQFNESSTGYVLSWLWDFGDGKISTEQNPSHTYETVDTFSVSLTVNGLIGSDTKIIDNFIIVDIGTGIDDNIADIPNKFVLMQNYPNPFNPSTKIRYQVPTTGLVTLRIYNVLGEVVTTLVNEEKPVGTFELNWNAESLSSGVYFYKLKAGNFVETKKMLLLK